MSEGELTRSSAAHGGRTTDSLLKVAPWAAFLLIALPAPLYFLVRYFTAADDFAVWMLFAITSFGVGCIAGLFVALVLVLYRRRWLRQTRNMLARDGITVAELQWFESEMTATERAALRDIKHHLLADAYRETLAARLTATRLVEQTSRELAALETRSREAQKLKGVERPALERELVDDHTRLRNIQEEARRRGAEAETRLQAIAATASRQQSEAETRIALERLSAAETQPHAIESAKLHREYADQIKRELVERDRLPPS